MYANIARERSRPDAQAFGANENDPGGDQRNARKDQESAHIDKTLFEVR